MSRAALNDGLDKFKRYRIGKRAKGMKLLRLWVPDPTAPGFAEEVRRQAALLRGLVPFYSDPVSLLIPKG